MKNIIFDLGGVLTIGKPYTVLDNLKPEECYFIDDNEINIKVVEEHGIKGYIYSINDSIEKIYSDMRSNGISI